MNRIVSLLVAGFAAVFLVPVARLLAQETPPEAFPFEGGTLTITETPDFDKILAFDGVELARNYVVYYDRTIELGQTKVALFAVGDGGNQCGPATVLIWKSKDDEVTSQAVGEDCGSPPAAATADSIHFVPYLIPGASAPAQVWSPEKGLRVAGIMTFTPQPGTSWADLDPLKLDNIVDAFDNEAIYEAGEKLLGAEMEAFATGLLTGGGTEITVSGAFYASGCVPHACGSANAFMAVDPKARKVYFAQQGEQPEPKSWPEVRQWPDELRQAMKTELIPPQ